MTRRFFKNDRDMLFKELHKSLDPATSCNDKPLTCATYLLVSFENINCFIADIAPALKI